MIYCACQAISDKDIQQRTPKICDEFERAGKKVTPARIAKALRQELEGEGRSIPNDCHSSCGAQPIEAIASFMREELGYQADIPVAKRFIIPDRGSIFPGPELSVGIGS